MTKTLALGVEHRQLQGLSPRLQQAVRLLQLSSVDFAQEVHDALGRNPFLEADESDRENPVGEAALTKDGGPPFAAEPMMEAQEFCDAPPPEMSEPGDTASEANDGFEGERERWQSNGLSGKQRNEAGTADLLQMRAIDESLSDYLLGQLHVLSLSHRDLALAVAIVGSLDDDGYLRFLLSDLVDITDLEPPPSEEELHIALSRVQALDPPGIAARSVSECLLLQLPAIVCPKQRELARCIIEQHLAELAARDIAGLARALARTPAEIEAVLVGIRRLDPHPGGRFDSAHVQYVTPDVIVRKVRGNWVATLNPEIVPKVRFNHVYARLFQGNRGGQHAELAADLQEARWTVSNVEQRFATILSVAQAIIGHQYQFLEYGAIAMKPLVLREIAQQVGLHESTVSRVTNNKFMATPLGVFELKYFFSRAMTTTSGGACSSIAIRGLVKDMIAAESPQAPLSDAEIARLLARQGLVVARRTVTKYRQLLHIEAFERRRKHS